MNIHKTSVLALATYVGTVMGVGLFGLPYVGAQTGFMLLLVYIVIGTIIAITINRMYASVATHTGGLHRLPGYAALYLGRWGKPTAFVVKLLALFGALLGYLIIGGEFLARLFDGSPVLYTFLFFIVAAFLIWQGAKSVGPVEFVLLFIFIGVVVVLFASGVGSVITEHLKGIHWEHFFAPYGVVLFSLWGASIIPEIKEELNGDLKKITNVIIWGLVICAGVYLLFSFLVIGVSGPDTSQDALSGLVGRLGPSVLTIGYIFGIITTFTSFITLGLTVQKLFWYDYRISKPIAWALATLIPISLYIVGFQDFISVISLTGAIMLGMDGILVTLVFLSLKKRQQSTHLRRHKAVSVILITMLVSGVVLELIYSIIGF